MTLTIPDQQTLYDRVYSYLRTHLQPAPDDSVEPQSPQQAALDRQVIKIAAWVVAATSYNNYKSLDYAIRQGIPLYAEGRWLEGHAEPYSIFRKAATEASGSIHFEGTPGTTIEAGSLFVANGISYATQELVVLGATDDDNTTTVIATEAGAHTNLEANTNLSPDAPNPEIQSTVTGDNGLSGGADVETDTQLRARLLFRLANIPHGGAVNDYIMWALEVPGVTRAWAYRNYAGPCTVGLSFMMDGNAHNGIPTDDDVQRVRDYINDDRRGPPDELHVFAPEELRVDHHILVGPHSPTIASNIEAELRDLYARIAAPGEKLFYTDLSAAVSAADQGTHRFIEPQPQQDIEPSKIQIPVFNSALIEPLDHY